MACITLLSDFGLQDASVAAARGIIMQHVPSVPIIDISHMVEPYHLQQAAYLLASSYSDFPIGTCHILLFDIFSERKPALVLCEINGHYFLAPDNGLLPLAFSAMPADVWKCYELQPEASFKDMLHEAGRIAAKLQDSKPHVLGLNKCELKNAPQHWRPRIEANMAECHVIHIDRFENVIVNITREEFERVSDGRTFRIQFMRDEEIRSISRHYNDVREGEELCLFNSTGYLEIAINRGKAASLFGLRLNNEKHVIYNTIKIFFE
ncbi:MAG: SAM-dependent chlorinase/fluorinase [Bacteroidetes bacterium]|nr:SAM-dependent chlorinase/fluorinase [Bacteroidota bacterium]